MSNLHQKLTSISIEVITSPNLFSLHSKWVQPHYSTNIYEHFSDEDFGNFERSQEISTNKQDNALTKTVAAGMDEYRANRHMTHPVKIGISRTFS